MNKGTSKLKKKKNIDKYIKNNNINGNKNNQT